MSAALVGLPGANQPPLTLPPPWHGQGVCVNTLRIARKGVVGNRKQRRAKLAQLRRKA